MKERGYNITELEKLNYNDLFDIYNDMKDEFTFMPLPECMKIRKKTIVKFLIYEKPTPRYLKDNLKQLKLDKYDDTHDIDLIIIFDRKVSDNILNINKYIQIFTYRDLLINKVSHILVPKHELITDTETIHSILVNYNLKTLWNLPTMLLKDPMVRYYNGKKGNVMKITRISQTSGLYISYRIIT